MRRSSKSKLLELHRETRRLWDTVAGALQKCLTVQLRGSYTRGVTSFGSDRYGCPLPNSDFALCLNVVPGVGRTDAMSQVISVLEQHPVVKRGNTDFDTLICSYDSFPVDVKVLEAAVHDGAIHSTDATRVMWNRSYDAAKLAVLAWEGRCK